MKNKLFILILAISSISFTSIVNAAGTAPMSIENKVAPSDSYLSTKRRSIGAETTVYTIASPTRGVNRQIDMIDGAGWGNPFLPGEGGWETGTPGNVGYPIGDVSLPILLSMLLIYFIYRGVSSSKRKSNF